MPTEYWVAITFMALWYLDHRRQVRIRVALTNLVLTSILTRESEIDDPPSKFAYTAITQLIKKRPDIGSTELRIRVDNVIEATALHGLGSAYATVSLFNDFRDRILGLPTGMRDSG